MPELDDGLVGRSWESNARAWTLLARQGYDVYRDFLNTPAFLEMLPSVKSLEGLDVGCGYGHNTRQVAALGAKMTGLDISPTFIAEAHADEAKDPKGIHYLVGDAQSLALPGGSFDFAVAFMSLMDMDHPERTLAEVFRVLRPGGFFQFSITHPCTDTPHRRNLRDAAGTTYAIEVGQYYKRGFSKVSRWLFGAAPAAAKAGLEPFAVPCFQRTLSDWINMSVAAGFRVEEMREPSASDAVVAQCQHLQDTQVMPYFLHLRLRKP